MGKSFSIILPKIVKWNVKKEKLIMDYLEGVNLEIMLKNQEFHTIGVEFVNTLLRYFQKNKFYWKDFAPRNIIISFEDRTISLVDFEKGFLPINASWNEYLSLIIEEYSCFLLWEEIIFKDILELFDANNDILYNHIKKSKRVKYLSEFLQLELENPRTKATLLYSLVIYAELPYVKKGKVIFPIIKYEYLLKEFGYEYWAFYVGTMINI